MLVFAQVQSMFPETSELGAKARINNIVTAIEDYASDNDGFLPENFDDLMGQDPPYLLPGAYEEGIEGYQFSITTELDNYKVIATPIECHQTGNKIFIKERGKELIEQSCETTS
jgi:hypothetical protein